MKPTAKLIIAVVLFFGAFIVAFAVFAPPVRAQDTGWGVSMIICPMCLRGEGHIAVVPFDSYERCDGAKQGMEITNRYAWIVCLNGSEDDIEAATVRAMARLCTMRQEADEQAFDECMAELEQVGE